MSRLVRGLSLTVLVLAITGCASAPAPEASSPSRLSNLEAAYGALDRADASVVTAVSVEGAPVAVREFGALQEDSIPAEKTLVDIGSITKTVTAVAISKLVDQSGVRLDEKLAEIFSGVPDDKSDITVEQLLTHSSGLPESVGDDFEQIDRDELLRRAFASPSIEIPGTRYAYSNVGYSILAAIIEVRSGKSYEEYLRDEVLAPAGIGGIGYLSEYVDELSMRSTSGESVREASWGAHEVSWNLVGNGGLVTTAPTFVRFLQELTSGGLLSPASLDRLQQPHIAEDDAGSSFYGYGLVVQDVPDLGRIYWHDGGNDVFSAEWSLYADHGDVIFTAGVDAAPGESAAGAAASVLREHLYGAKD
ncbi:serine hydrolase domain-containing protein [Microbacterium sp. LBN7]|uniref:serine hydrolase domain-containing protein n=1 Tax=Microbacterium sp. LBN7 TaxID=3129773 RepID=UPI003255D087